LLAGLFVLFARGPAPARAAGPAGTVLLFPPGWNLVAFATTPPAMPRLVGALYTWQPNDNAYEQVTPAQAQPGLGYWAYFSGSQTVALTAAPRTSSSLLLPAGQCALVGNPSSGAAARVSDASRVYAYATGSHAYIAGGLLDLGRGGWACNDGARSARVYVTDQGDVLSADFPACCAPQPYDGGGKALLVLQNDSPYPLLAAAAQVDDSGQFVAAGATTERGVGGCRACPEYHSHDSCNDTVSVSQDVPAGRYLLHLQSEGPNVPDLQTVVELQPNTAYYLCYWVSADRPLRNGP
jgi:hypothetical protein